MLVSAQEQKPLRWQKGKVSPWGRQREVFTTAFLFLFFLWWDNWRRLNNPEQKTKRAKWLVQELLELGPSFIKIGQALSTRVDILPPEYLSALAELQDKVPPFPTEIAIDVIEAEFNRSIHSIFLEFNPQPLAAASLGQVHRAKLHTGEEVVVKVQRPDLRRLLDLDYQAVGKLVTVLKYLFKANDNFGLFAIYEEFFNILYQEIDYTQEARNADRFRHNFRNYPRILVPKVYWEYTSTRVLTLEYLPGIKVDDIPALKSHGLDPRDINELGIRSYLKQFLQDGFFHADPHPGNLAVTPTGNLIFYDYGMMYEVETNDREVMLKTFFAILKKDTNEVVDRFTSLGLLEPTSDMKPVKRMVQFILDRFTEKPFDIKAFGEIRKDIVAAFEQQPFRLPAKMTYLLKCVGTLVGIALILDPEYNFRRAAQPFILSLARQKGNVFSELARQTKAYLESQLNKPNPTELLLKRIEEKLERHELMIPVRNELNDRILYRISLGMKCLIRVCITGFLLISATLFLVNGWGQWGVLLLILTCWSGLSVFSSLTQLSLREKLDKLMDF
jgi:predicted unusual protein kinase regulating ubiquinone biosynthesis (AarF/ABC1/UbiB family)